MAPRPQQGQAGPGRMGQIQPQLLARVTQAFFRTGRFQMVERAQLNAGSRKASSSRAGWWTTPAPPGWASQMGAAFVLVGNYTGSIGHTAEVTSHFFGGKTREDAYPGHLEVRLDLVNTEDGSIREAFLIHAASQDAKAYHAYELLLDDLTANLEKETAARFPMMGYVIKVISEREALVTWARPAAGEGRRLPAGGAGPGRGAPGDRQADQGRAPGAHPAAGDRCGDESSIPEGHRRPGDAQRSARRWSRRGSYGRVPPLSPAFPAAALAPLGADGIDPPGLVPALPLDTPGPVLPIRPVLSARLALSLGPGRLVALGH